jgi:predicted small integral membrane protein
MAVLVNMVCAAMKQAWSNPISMKLRAIEEKGDNLFIAELGSSVDTERSWLELHGWWGDMKLS